MERRKRSAIEMMVNLKHARTPSVGGDCYSAVRRKVRVIQ